MTRNHWLMKSEPDVYAIEDLARDGEAEWEGVRNYQARNIMRDQMREGDLVLYYHSNASPSGVVGLAEVCREAYPDYTQFDPGSPYHDPKATEDEPRWWMVDLRYLETFPRKVSLKEIKAEPALAEMALVRRPRLSVQPVASGAFARILEMAGARTPTGR